MRNNPLYTYLRPFLLVAILFIFNGVVAQNKSTTPKPKSVFWQKVQFGGGIGLGLGTGYTDISLAPSAIYNRNQYVSLGVGAQYSYASQKNVYNSHLYGGSIIALCNPIEKIQLSAELEQLRVNVTVSNPEKISDNFWNTGLFLGAGYRTNNVTVGARYNVLHDSSKRVYNNAFLPFVRVYF
ncbi:hypothetical protein [Flavobacterium crassostreae]|uniref:Alpha-ketoglutarate decarboxylase n=1 Tax=Flavobacterium crassostreae TaxID=1763534 RepID=A0A1B9DXB2_9FLAO|nr:hypothetical protein [Flavobacterium crassostreae]OCB74319.1 hypothetical protein LPBF_09965 [Flavobacterium crassostreae]